MKTSGISIQKSYHFFDYIYTINKKTKAFLRDTTLSEKEVLSKDPKKISLSKYKYPVYAWIEENPSDRKFITIYWWTEADRIIMPENCCNLFSWQTDLKELDLSGLDFSQVKCLDNMFSYDKSLKKCDLSQCNFDSVESIDSIFYGCIELEEVIFPDMKNNPNAIYMMNSFAKCMKLKIIYLKNIKVKCANYTFQECNELEEMDISTWDFSEAEEVCFTFYDCSKLKIIDFSNKIMDKVRRMDSIFYGCNELRIANMENISARSNLSIDFIFCDCIKLRTLILRNSNFGKNATKHHIYKNCISLTDIKTN